MTQRTAVFWNVQRLFGTEGGPVARSLGGVGADWNARTYRRKIANLAGCLRRATGGEPPVLLGLAEVETVQAVRDLAEAAGWPELVCTDEVSPDPGLDGLDVALLLDPEVFDVGDLEATSVALDNRFNTRDLLDVRVRVHGRSDRSAVMVAHWPSRLIPEGQMLRLAYSVHLRRRLTRILSYDRADLLDRSGRFHLPAPQDLLRRWQTGCIVLGDLNDEPWDPSVRSALASTRSAAAVRRRGRLTGKRLSEVDNYLAADCLLLDPCWDLRLSDTGAVGGTYYRGEWRTYDHLLFSHGMLDPDSALGYVEGSVRAFRDPAPDDRISMVTSAGHPRPYRPDSPTGVSDHLPLVFRLTTPDPA